MTHQKKKKDFKLRVEVVKEFENLAPSGKQTAIVEQLIVDWIKDQRRAQRAEAVQSAYEKELFVSNE